MSPINTPIPKWRKTPIKTQTNLIWLRNIGIIAIKIQICILYFTSGFMKATGDYWSNGTAMYYISRVEWFSHPAMRDVFLNPYVTTIAT
uniref:hypothetical protein n=1 Tax=Roseivirga sp. TaxID=1964215 RepID=UPI004048BBFB